MCRLGARRTLPGHRRGHVAFSPDGSLFVSGGLHDDVRIWEMATWRIVATLDHTSAVWSLAFQPDGSRLVLSQPPDHAPEEAVQHKTLQIWGTRPWAFTENVDVGSDTVYATAFSPDGRYAALSGPPSGRVAVWDAAMTQQHVTFSVHARFTYGLHFSSDSGLLATCGADHRVRFWETGTWQLCGEFAQISEMSERSAEDNLLCVAFSPAGARLVVGGLNGFVTCYRVKER